MKPNKYQEALKMLQELVDKETPMKVDINTEGVYYRTKLKQI